MSAEGLLNVRESIAYSVHQLELIAQILPLLPIPFLFLPINLYTSSFRLLKSLSFDLNDQ